MNKRQIFVTVNDHKKLSDELLAAANERGRNDLKALEAELGRAKIVESHEMPPDVVTMNTRLVFRDLEDKTKMEVTIVFPSEADIDQGKMSVLSPIGTALLGYAKGDTIKWEVPGGKRRVRVEEILYQPEASGDHHL